jgi:hypothetical protein
LENTWRLNGEQDMLDAGRKGYSAGGYRGLLKAMLVVSQQRIRNGISVSPVHVAELYLRLGDYDHAFEWLEKAYSERSGSLTYLVSDPVFETVKSDARYIDLVKRVGLPLH